MATRLFNYILSSRLKRLSFFGAVLLAAMNGNAMPECDTTAVSATTGNTTRITAARDSNLQNNQHPILSKRIDRISGSRLYQMTYIGVPLIIGGIIERGEDAHFRNLRNDYIPTFKHEHDTYTQLLPAAVMLGMKSFGVESRSSWSRMLTSCGISAVIMAATVRGLKSSIDELRPDGSDKKSFPSGHTATAFMTATMLSKEYGHISPLINIGAYGTAAATGLMRIANNRHWMSDVMVGAGIGILSTELGYLIGDAVFRDKGINRHIGVRPYLDRFTPPSFAGLYVGFNVPLSDYDITESMSFRTSSGCHAGFEGAHFFNPYVGVGGRITVSNVNIITSTDDAANNTTQKQAETERWDMLNISTGGYFSYPISYYWQIGGKLLVGYVHYPSLTLISTTVPARNGISAGTGLSMSLRAERHLTIRFFTDYNILPPHSKQMGEYMHSLSLGAVAAYAF